MKHDDPDEPGDAALQVLLAGMALHATQVERRDQLLDFAVAVPPLTEWPTKSLQELQDTCEYVMSLALLGRELRHLTGEDGQQPSPCGIPPADFGV